MTGAEGFQGWPQWRIEQRNEPAVADSGMKCLQLERPGRLHLLRKSLPAPEAGEVLLRVLHCALCRTDAKMFQQGHRDLQLPRVLGHECCGLDPETGERFVIWPGSSCGDCERCRSGEQNLCRDMRIVGFHRDGGLAEFLAAEKTSLIPVPPALPSETACLAEPLACALNALDQAALGKGDRLLIYGAGPVGLLMALAAASMGVDTAVAERRPEKLLRTEEFRAMLGIRVETTGNPSEYDAVINAAPATETFTDGLAKLRPGGCFCLFSGLSDATATIPIHAINDIHYRQLRVTGAYGCTLEQIRQAVGLLSTHRLQAGLLIERKIHLEQVPEVIPEVLSGNTLKLVVEF